MQIGKKQILVIGDRLLVKPETTSDRTKVGLYLPQTVVEKEPVQAGRVVETGPGIAIPNFTPDSGEPWQEHRPPVKYMPVQAEVGDFVLFLRKEAIEIQYESEDFLIISQGAVLLVIRETE